MPGIKKCNSPNNQTASCVLPFRRWLRALRRGRGADSAGAGRTSGAGCGASASAAGGTNGKPIAELGALLEFFGKASFKVFGGKLSIKIHGNISFTLL
jgi:hypothetical protein